MILFRVVRATLANSVSEDMAFGSIDSAALFELFEASEYRLT